MPSGVRDKRPESTSKDVVKEAKKEKTTGPMDRWVEPALATKASYEDHNGAPYGVMEHMQPLGEAPSGKVRARVKAEGVRKSVAGRSAATANATPEGTPQPPTQTTTTRQQVKLEQPRLAAPPPPAAATAAAASPRPPATPPRQTIKKKNDNKRDEDTEYDPVPVVSNGKKKKTKESTRIESLPKLHIVGSQGMTTLRETTTIRKETIDNPGSNGMITVREVPSVNLRPEECTEERIASVVREAKERACTAGNFSLANAVQEVYNDSKRIPRLHLVLIKVLSQTASADDLAEFQSHARAAKLRLAAAKAAPAAVPSPAAAAPKAALAAPLSTAHQKATQENPTNSTTTTKPRKLTKSKANGAVQGDLPQTTTTTKAKVTTAPVKAESSRASSTAQALPTRSGVSFAESPIIEQRKKAQKGRKVEMDSDDSELTDFDTDEDTTITNGVAETKAGASMNQKNEQEAVDANPRERAAARKSREASRASLAVPQTNNQLKRSSEEAELDKGTTPDPEFHVKKQKLTSKVQRDSQWEESNERTLRLPRNNKTRNASSAHGSTRQQTRQAGDKDIASGDSDSPLSSPALSHRFTPPPISLKGHTGKRAKTKQSPEKKSSQTMGHLSGLTTGAAGSFSPMDVVDSDAEGSENNDYCSACSGSGYLLCCDGCDRSFHFTCLDPPLAPDAEELNEPWFCYQCLANKRLMGEAQAEKQRFGLFAPLFANLTKRNPSIFALPTEVQNYYDGVGADQDGNFANTARAGKKKAGYGDPVDLYKLRDNKGNLLFCYSCQRTSQGNRQVVQCDECSQIWHLDCLDPPLATNPCITGDGRRVADWLCPLHIEHELKYIEARRLFNQQQGRKLHVRKPRGAKTVETFLSRGAGNNGLIEINQVDSSENDDSESEFYLEEDPRREDVILKVPDTGLKLDFIAKIKQARIQNYRDHQFDQRLFGKAQGSRVQMVNTRRLALTDNSLSQHTLHEQQTALNLAQFAQADTNKDLGLGRNNVETLIAGLVAEAPAKVLGHRARSRSVAVEAEDLLALQQLITRRLEKLKT